jgi:hypothetical protein
MTIGEVLDAKDRALIEANARIMDLERQLSERPTNWAYEAACKALWHWRVEAERLGKICGEEARKMGKQS